MVKALEDMSTQFVFEANFRDVGVGYNVHGIYMTLLQYCVITQTITHSSDHALAIVKAYNELCSFRELQFLPRVPDHFGFVQPRTYRIITHIHTRHHYKLSFSVYCTQEISLLPSALARGTNCAVWAPHRQLGFVCIYIYICGNS